MKVRIFQIDHEKDKQKVRFENYENTLKIAGEVSPENYRQIYGGELLADNLDDVFLICNSDKKPPGYCGHSLSVSDVVEICDGRDKGAYFVDSFCFKKLNDFDIGKTDHEKMMKILVLENDRAPYAAEIRHDIHAMQSVVGGCIEPVYFEPKGDAICWCNDEFLLNNSAPNRFIGGVLVHGTCYISGNCINKYGEYDSCSLTDEQIEKYSNIFSSWLVHIQDIGEDLDEDEGMDIKI